MVDGLSHALRSARHAGRDLAELAGWTNDLFESDVDAAATFVSDETHNEKLFVAGFSRGVELRVPVRAADPERVAGLVILDGFIPSHPAAAMPAGRVADDIGGQHLTYDKRHTLMEMVIRNPVGLRQFRSTKPRRKSRARGHDADGVFGGHGGLANPEGGFSDASVLARVLIGYDR